MRLSAISKCSSKFSSEFSSKFSNVCEGRNAYLPNTLAASPKAAWEGPVFASRAAAPARRPRLERRAMSCTPVIQLEHQRCVVIALFFPSACYCELLPCTAFARRLKQRYRQRILRNVRCYKHTQTGRASRARISSGIAQRTVDRRAVRSVSGFGPGVRSRPSRAARVPAAAEP